MRYAGLVLLAAVCSLIPVLPDSSARAAGPTGDAMTLNRDRRDLTLAGVKPAEHDTLALAYPNDPDTLNPITGNDTVSESFQRWVYETLADEDFHNPDLLVPSLASSWQFDKQKLEFTINLRKGVKWHPMRLPNGTPLPETEFTARDVAFSFQCVLNPHVEAAAIRSFYEDPEAKEESERYKVKLRAIDKYTVKIRWTKPYFLAEMLTLSGFPIIPRHVFSVDANGEPISFDFSSKEFADGFNNHWANRKMCGTGPMVFKDWTREQRLELTRNPNYWGPAFYFSQVIFRCIANPNTIVEQLLQNELDFAAIAEKDRYRQCKTHPNVLNGKVKLVDYEYPGYRYIGYNLQRDLFKDQQFRRALAHAMPIQKIIDEVFKGLAVPTTGPEMPGSSAYDSSVKLIPYDLDAARKVLDAAGWIDRDGSGIRSKIVKDVRIPARFDLMIYSDAPSFLTVAEIFKENCRKIGVEVLISPAKWALMLQKLRKREFDAAMLGWALSWKSDPYQIWHSSQADAPESSNHVAYRNPEVDKLIERLRVTLDEPTQNELFHQMHRIIYDDQPYLFLFVDKQTAAYDSRLENIRFYKIRPCHDEREWWAKTPRVLGQ